jgi:hypothetical protein
LISGTPVRGKIYIRSNPPLGEAQSYREFDDEESADLYAFSALVNGHKNVTRLIEDKKYDLGMTTKTVNSRVG